MPVTPSLSRDIFSIAVHVKRLLIPNYPPSSKPRCRRQSLPNLMCTTQSNNRKRRIGYLKEGYKAIFSADDTTSQGKDKENVFRKITPHKRLCSNAQQRNAITQDKNQPTKQNDNKGNIRTHARSRATYKQIIRTA
jgi:hypothetical protein